MGRATRERVILISREARKKYEEAFGLKPLFFSFLCPVVLTVISLKSSSISKSFFVLHCLALCEED